MPALSDPRHERFCLLRLAGKTIDAAYEEAGFKQNRSNAARLAAQPDIMARVKELNEFAAQKALEVASFDAKQMFVEVMQDIADAKAAGDHKTAATLRMFMIRCFGYEDSPTLTHEHVRGKPIAQETAKEGQGEEAPPSPRVQGGSNVLPLSKAIRDLKRRIQET
ncbi:MAG TPA: hypothetical protein VGN93_13280 [Shinella sp.]|jgi:hypothetical protein|uniref:hypothetical protein n=1 Tax=Shinella sp. TaxID=1870904 RepID=UPI002E1325DB|nr:hypothetical protein [Shinella sp.]